MTNSCAICGSIRANIVLLQCGHVLHDRCLFPWPCKYCPVVGCHREIVNFECLKIEAFHYSGIKYECSNLMRVFGVNRRGRWTEEEYEYALALIEAFNAGLVHLPESLKLGSFLCKMLQCCAARLSSKIRKGKKVFHSKRIQEGVAVDSCEIAHYRSVQQKLSDAEREFLNKIAISFDPEVRLVYTLLIMHLLFDAVYLRYLKCHIFRRRQCFHTISSIPGKKDSLHLPILRFQSINFVPHRCSAVRN